MYVCGVYMYTSVYMYVSSSLTLNVSVKLELPDLARLSGDQALGPPLLSASAQHNA